MNFPSRGFFLSVPCLFNFPTQERGREEIFPRALDFSRHENAAAAAATIRRVNEREGIYLPVRRERKCCCAAEARSVP